MKSKLLKCCSIFFVLLMSMSLFSCSLFGGDTTSVDGSVIDTIEFYDESFYYDGEAHSIYIDEEFLPDGYYVEYMENDQIEVGTYEVIAIIYNENGEIVREIWAFLEILENYEMFDNIKFYDESFYYDGEAHSIYIDEEELPEGYYVEYTGNDQIEVGGYEVSAIIYNANGDIVIELQATIEILSISNPSITIDIDGEVSYQEVTFGTSVDFLSIPTKEGYTFVGWYLDGELYDVTQAVKIDIYLEAYFTINTYTITFEVEGETTSQEVEYGQEPVYSTTPTKEADDIYTYEFEGWDKELSVATQDETYVACFTSIINTYNVVFSVDGETTTQVVEHGSTIDFYEPLKEGYVFNGWYLDEACTKLYDFSTEITSDTKLYVDWSEGTSGLTYSLNTDGISYTVSSADNSLTEVVIASSYNGLPVTSISSSAFNLCHELDSITIPNTITYIGVDVFSTLDVAIVNYNGTMTDWMNIEFAKEYSNPMSVCEEIYMLDDNNNYYELNQIVIPEGVTTIKSYAFSGFSYLYSITLPEGVEELESYAFYNCYNLCSIVLPTTLESIGSYVFSGCEKLVEVYNLSDIEITNYIVGSALNIYDESGESNISIEDGFIIYEDDSNVILLMYIGNETNVVIPENIIEISLYAFENSVNLESITIGSNIEIIGHAAFSDCYNLENVYYTGTIADWCNITFANYNSTPMYYAENFYMLDSDNNYYLVTSIIIPNTVSELKNYTFSGFDYLCRIEIPQSVTSIGTSTFSDCFRLLEIYNLSNVSISESMARYALNIYDESGESKISIEDGFVIYSDDFDTILIVYLGEEINIEIPQEITKIYQYAFYNNKTIESVVIGDNVLTIGGAAFFGCSNLESIIIGSNVETIEYSAFAYCSKITQIVIPESVQSISTGILGGCENLESVTLPNNYFESYYYFYYLFYVDDYSSKETLVPSSLSNITITGVNDIKTLEFDYCQNVESIAIYGVSKIASNAFYCLENLTTVTLDNTLESISYNAFYGCVNIENVYYSGTIADWCSIDFANEYSNPLYYAQNFYVLDENGEYYLVEEIIIEDGVEYIGSYAFYGLNCNTSLVIPDSVEYIGYAAFYGFDNLESITLPFVGDGGTNTNFGYIFGADSVSSNVNYVPTTLINVTLTTATTITEEAFYGCIHLVTIQLPQTLQEIGDLAFYNCYNLVEIYNLSNLDITLGSTDYGRVGYYAYNIYTDITTESKISIDEDGFVLYTSEEDVILVGYLGDATDIVIPESVTIINAGSMSLTDITSVVIGENVVSIDKYAFYDCDSLTEITIGKNVESIGTYAFLCCYKLTEIYNASSLSITIGSTSYGYVGYCAVVIYNLEDNTKFVNEDGFILYYQDDSVLLVSYIGNETDVVIPNSVTEIHKYAFYDCDNITNITIGENIVFIDESAFYWIDSLENVYYTGTIEDWCNIEFETNYSNPMYFAENFYMLDENNKYYLIEELVIPDSVTSINTYAFCGFSQLTSVVIPSSVGYIGYSSFYGCSNLESITLPFVGDGDTNTHFGYIFGANSYSGQSSYIPESLTSVIITGGSSIEKYAFYGCNYIKNIVIPNSVESIGYRAFYNCSSLESMTLPFVGDGGDTNTYFGYIFGASSSWDQSSYIPINLIEVKILGETAIYNYAFYNCYSLISVTIGADITEIGYSAFYGCEKLVEIYNLSKLDITLGSSDYGYIGYYAYNIYSDTYGYSNLIIDEDGFVLYEDGSDVILLGYIGNETRIAIPSNVTQIYKYAFYNHTDLINITIPQSVESVDYEAFLSCTNLVSIYYTGTIEDWMSIEFASSTSNPMYYATNFYMLESSESYTRVTSIEIPESITYIGEYTFYGFNNVVSITIHEDVETIDSYAFSNCDNLVNVYYTGTIEEWMNIDFSDWYSNPMSYASHFYMLDETGEYYEVTEIEIPESITYIGEYTFYGFNNVISITIHEDVESIGNYAFNACDNLVNVYYNGSLEEWMNIEFSGWNSNPMTYGTHFYMLDEDEEYYEVTEIEIPESITYIGEYTFYGFNNVVSITIHEDVESIGNYAFLNCTNLVSIYYAGTIEEWMSIEFSSYTSNPMDYASHFYMLDEAEEYYELTEIEIPESITYIGEYTFYGFNNVISITIHDSVETIDSYAFCACYNLVDVYYNGSLEEWMNIDFSGQYSNPMYYASHFYMLDEAEEYYEVTEIEIPESITYIGAYTFYGFNNVISITIHEDVETIDSYAFSACYNLISITIPKSIEYINWGAFLNCYKLVEVYNLSSITIVKGSEDNGYIGYYALNIYTDTYGSSKLSKDEDGFVLYTSDSYVIVVGYEGTNTDIIIPDNVNEINQYAFYGLSQLTSVVIPSNVEYIGKSAFYGCTNLESITIPFVGDGDTNTYFGYIFGAEYYTYNSDYVPSRLTSVTITGGSSIESYAFYYCTNLISIVIPGSIESLGNNVFDNCTSLENIYYSGSIEDWLNIEFEYAYSNPMYYAENFYMLDEDGEYYLLTEIEIPDTVTTINDYAFYGFSQLVSVVIHDSVEYIGYSAFGGCDNLESITIPFVGDGDTNTHFGYIFGATSYWQTSYIPNSLTSVIVTGGSNIDAYAFYYCTNLISIVIPGSIESLGNNVFDNCTSLENIYYSGSIEDWLNIEFEYAYSNPMYYAENFYMLSEDGDYYLLTELIIPDTVTTINDYAFYNLNSLETVYYNGSIEDWLNIEFEYAYSNPMYYAENFYMLDEDGEYYLLTEIEIPDTVTTINDYAFYGFSQLVSVVIPSNVEYIGYAAFGGCDNLASITIPFVGDGDTNTHFGYIFGATAYWETSYIPSSLISVTITGGSSIENYAFYESSNIEIITISTDTNICVHAFYNCSNLETLIFAGQCTIASNAVCGCDNLLDVAIAYSDGISNYAFVYCNNLSKVEIKGGNSIVANAFSYCYSLTSIVIPGSVEYIDSPMYYYLENVYYNGTIEDWCNIEFETAYSNPMYYAENFYMLGEDGEYYLVTEVIIPDTVTSINDYAFYGFSQLTSVVIPDSVISIGMYAFYNCYHLVEIYNFSSITISKSSTSNGYIGYYAINIYTDVQESKISVTEDGFVLCTDGEGVILVKYIGEEIDVVIPDGITSINRYAFYECSNLESVVIPDSVTYIGDCAFFSCTSLEVLVIGTGLTNMGYSVFYNCYKMLEIYNLSNYEIILGGTDSGYIGYYAVVVYDSLDAKSELVTDGDYILYYNGDDVTLVKYIGEETDVIIPDYITYIHPYAFYECGNLTSITITASVIKIGLDAFYLCDNLLNVYYNGSIEDWCNIEFQYSFSNPMYYAENFYMLDEYGEYYLLTELIIPEGTTSINDYVFFGFGQLTSVVIPDSVESIGYDAFYYCSNVTTLFITSSVLNIIGSAAFGGCYNLETVYYSGTIDEWNNIYFENEYANPMYYAENLYVLNSETNEYELVIFN